MLRIGVPKESFPGERRVALTPAVLPSLDGLGAEVLVEAGAGVAAGFSDESYRDKGARVAASRAEVLASDVVLQVRTLGANPREGRSDLPYFQKGTTLVGFANPFAPRESTGREEGARPEGLEAIDALAERGVSLFALELLPRTSRAQAMDALTSMAMLAGYKAVLLAAEKLPRVFPMMVTAAGTLTPARVLVVGAGVAGLSAIAVAKRLGAVVSAYDVRPEVKEEIESLGARFVELPLDASGSGDERGYARAMGEDFYRRQGELLFEAVSASDVVISTAAVPGKRAPLILSYPMVESMGQGSVVVDLAAGSGGNCEATRPDEEVRHRGVTILGPTNLPSTIPYHASQMYAKNITAFVQNLVRNGAVQNHLDDEILRETLVLLNGEKKREE